MCLIRLPWGEQVRSGGLVRNHWLGVIGVARVQVAWTSEQPWKGKETQKCRNFLEVEPTGLADRLTLGVRGSQEPRVSLWFLA